MTMPRLFFLWMGACIVVASVGVVLFRPLTPIFERVYWMLYGILGVAPIVYLMAADEDASDA